MRSYLLLLSIFNGVFGLTQAVTVAQAQITSDGTANTTVNTTGLNTTLTNGTVAGPNLFHSFGQFSVPTGGSASFDLSATPSVRTIFSRVTGGNVSTIDGLIRTANSTSPVSLFLINPAGIVFGSNAQLRISGSFVATTAHQIRFADGSEFSATPAAPLLTLSVPVGLQFNGSNGGIQVQGRGNDGIVPTANLGIIGSPGQTIALVGGDVSSTGGVITSPAGRIELGAVGTGVVSLTPTPAGWQLGYAQVQEWRDVNLTTRSSLWNPDPVGNRFGGIQVVGRDISLNQSQIAAATVGPRPGGAVTVTAQRSLSLGGYNVNAQAPSAWIVNQVGRGATGNGGAVNIQAGQLSLQEGAGIETFSLGPGAAGNVQVRADTILASGTVRVTSPLIGVGSSSSHISSTAYTAGAGGDVDVVAQQITLTDSGQIATYVLPGATGRGGNITVKASEITAANYNPLSLTASGIQTYTLGVGNGGAVNLTTDRLTLVDSGSVFTFTSRIAGSSGTGIGNAGDITILSRDAIALTGTSPNQPDLISYVGSVTVGSGNSGNVWVTAPRLSVQAGGGLGTTTLPVVGRFGDRTQSNNLGNAGNLTLNITDRIEVDGFNRFTETPSSLGTSTFGNGNTGNVTVQTQQLRVSSGGTIAAYTGATGNAGTLTIQAKDILVEGRTSQRSSIAASAPLLNLTTRQFYQLPNVPTGDTGTVRITTHRLTIRDQATISVNHEGQGNAGQLTIQAVTLLAEQGSIKASTASGQGGNINLQIRDRLLLRQGSEIVATAGGTGNGGNITLNAPIVAGFENSDIVANAVRGQGGNIQITTQGIFGLKFRSQLTPNNDITATSEFGVNGTVQVNTIGVDPSAGLVELPLDLTDPTQQITAGCAGVKGNQFVITGRGGVPENPTQGVKRDRPWTDLRDPAAFRSPSPQRSNSPTLQPITEATTWQRNADGAIELVAIASGRLSLASAATCAGAEVH